LFRDLVLLHCVGSTVDKEDVYVHAETGGVNPPGLIDLGDETRQVSHRVEAGAP
jgi:hypothetical protein